MLYCAIATRLHNVTAYKTVKGKAIPLQAWRPLGFQEIEASRFLDNRHMKVVRLSPYAPAAFTPQEIILVLISVRG
jgi:hypothetical protein